MMKLNIKNWTNQNIKVVIFLVLFTLFGSCTKYKEKTLQDIGYWDVVYQDNKYQNEPYYGYCFKKNKYFLYGSNRHYEFHIQSIYKDGGEQKLKESIMLEYYMNKDSLNFKFSNWKIESLNTDSIVLTNSHNKKILKPSKYAKIIKEIEKKYK